MEKEVKLKILFRIPFTLYFLALVEFRYYKHFKRKRVLCLAVKEFLDYEQETNYYFREISDYKHINN